MGQDGQNVKKRRLSDRVFLIILCAAVLLSVSGCAAREEEVVTNQSSKTKISFSWWGNDPRHKYTLEGLRIFEKKHPDIQVSHLYGIWDGYERRYQIMMLSHSQADVMQVNYGWLSKYAPDGTGYYDLNTLSDVIDLSNFSSEDKEIGTVGGHLIALPIAYNTTVLFYNKDIYDRYGIEIPTTWEELEAAAKLMRDDGIYPVGMVAKHLFLLLNAWYEQQTGEQLFDENGRYMGDAEDAALLLKEYKRFVDEKVLPPANEYDDGGFVNQTLAGVACWVSDSTRYCSQLAENGVSVVVGDRLHTEREKSSGWYVKPATMYTISADAQDPQAAGILLDYLLNDADMALLQGTEKGVPVSRKALNTLREEDRINSLEYDASCMIRDNQEELSMMRPILEDADIQQAFTEVSVKYIYGREELEAAAKELHDRFSEIAA